MVREQGAEAVSYYNLAFIMHRTNTRESATLRADTVLVLAFPKRFRRAVPKFTWRRNYRYRSRATASPTKALNRVPKDTKPKGFTT